MNLIVPFIGDFIMFFDTVEEMKAYGKNPTETEIIDKKEYLVVVNRGIEFIQEGVDNIYEYKIYTPKNFFAQKISENWINSLTK
jgi:hypothetical protein